MNKSIIALCAAALATPGVLADATVQVDQSDANWLGFMNVYNLPAPDGDGAFQFGSPWGVADLVAQFDDVDNTLTMLPNQINDPDPYWYQGGGGPGAPGNKIMEANLYQENIGGLSGMTVTFEGTLESIDFTEHEVRVFIRDFAGDFSSSVDNFVQLTSAGDFSISLDTIDDASRVVQWGVQVKGVNVWETDIEPFGSAVFTTVPTPGALALLGMGGLVASRRRR